MRLEQTNLTLDLVSRYNVRFRYIGIRNSSAFNTRVWGIILLDEKPVISRAVFYHNGRRAVPYIKFWSRGKSIKIKFMNNNFMEDEISSKRKRYITIDEIKLRKKFPQFQKELEKHLLIRYLGEKTYEI